METTPYPGDSLDRLHHELLEMLKVFDTACKEAQLTYFIEGGTALGALRHGGFIPWDDDVDVSMPSADYERMLEVLPQHLPGGYSLHTWENTPRYTRLWATLWKDGTRFQDSVAVEAGMEQGIFLDIFRLVRLDRDPGIAARQRRRLLFWQRMAYLKYLAHPHNVPNRALELACEAAHGVVRHMPMAHIAKMFERACHTENPGDLMVDATYADYEPIPAQDLLPPAPIKFEGIELMGPHNIEAYLRATYGDWQALPPADKRYTHAPEVLDFGDGINVVEAAKKQS